MSEAELKCCPDCGAYFTPRSRRQRFCSPQCLINYYHHTGNKHDEPQAGAEILRSFHCRNCGRLVEVAEQRDRRTVFCCQPCEKKYWRDRTRHSNSKHEGNLGMSGGMSLGSLIRRESCKA